jgi:tetratricopeptide (TPR) repeat protein
VPLRRVAPWVVLLAVAVIAGAPFAQPPPAGTAAKGNNGDLDLVKHILDIRKDYQKSLENLRLHYLKVGDLERAKWAEEELRQYHRIPKQAFILDLDVPPPNLQGHTNVPEANKLLTWALKFKDKGWGVDYQDNQRRAEILLQDLLTKYPHSDKISDAAYYLGDIYESKAYKQFRRAAAYYERCFQWDPKTHLDARLRAARLYDFEVKDRARAIELYREITTHETDAKRIEEATKRLSELSALPK